MYALVVLKKRISSLWNKLQPSDREAVQQVNSLSIAPPKRNNNISCSACPSSCFPNKSPSSGQLSPASSALWPSYRSRKERGRSSCSCCGSCSRRVSVHNPSPRARKKTKPEISNSAAERHTAAQGNCDARADQHVRQHAQLHAPPPRSLTPNPRRQPVAPARPRSKGCSAGNTDHFTN